MSLVPKSLSRMGYRSLLKLNASSPTILVVAGVAGLVGTAVLASKATRRIDPILDEHKQARAEIGIIGQDRDRQMDLVRLYSNTGLKLSKLYGPTIFIGTTSTIAVLGGHRILHSRQIATMAAYTGLIEQFQAYRGRVSQTLGEEMERKIFEGAHGEYVEDPDHPGEYKLQAKYDKNTEMSYLRPWFDETNVNWTRDAEMNYYFLKGCQSHMNNMLQVRGHVFLNDVFDQLRIPRCPEGAIAGWVYHSDGRGPGDNFVDFGFMTSEDPNSVAFRNGAEKVVRLNFNIDPGPIWSLI